MHEAFFFGPTDRQIFGVYHPALGIDTGVLTVICPPLLSELNRTHSALRNLAIALAQKGQHVLRFDYTGTGDSHGHLADASMAHWVEDIQASIQEGRDLTGCRAVRVLAVRAGALLACNSVHSQVDVDRVVLWDPIASGSEYLSALDREQASVIDTHHYLSRAEQTQATSEYSIYGMSAGMLSDIESIDSGVYQAIDAKKFRVVCTSSTGQFPVENASEIVVPFECYWETKIDGVVFSQPVLEQLLTSLTAA